MTVLRRPRGCRELVEPVRRQMRVAPSAPAVVSGDRTVRYGDLVARTEELAGRLADCAEERPVVAVLGRDPEDVVPVLLATLDARGVFVPLDPTFPAARLETMVDEVAPDVVVVPPALLDQARALPGTLQEELEAAELVLRRLRAPARAVPTENEDVCSVIYTSGSTGKPKGILGSLRGLAHFVAWELDLLGVEPGTRFSQLASPAFDPFLRDTLIPLASGGTLCTPRLESGSPDLGDLAAWLDDQGVQVLHCVPSMFRMLLRQELHPGRFPGLRYVLLSGEAVLPSDIRRWTEVFGDRVGLFNLYGPTETTLTKFWYRVSAADAELPSIPIGRPMPGARAVLVGEDGRPCPPGMVGEIYIRTPYRSWGYLNRPDQTARSFIPNPFGSDSEDIVYRTGDQGRLRADGVFEFLGRRDHQVQVRGARVELGEVERAVAAAPRVAEAVAAVYEDPVVGTSLCAYVVAPEGVDLEALRRHCAELLPSYMLPSLFVTLDALPRTPNGKTDRRRLPPPLEAVATKRTVKSPESELEREIAGLWAEVVGTAPAEVSMDDSFFLTGGNSLSAVLLLARISSRYGIRMSPAEIFERSTVSQLAARVAELRPAREDLAVAPDGIGRVPRGGELPLSFAQERLWFFSRLAPEDATYNMPAAFRVTGPLKVQALHQILGEIARRHEVLRTRFATRDDQPVQVIDEPGPCRFPFIDLGALGPDERRSETLRLAARETRRPFALETDHAWRARIVRRDPQDHAVLFTMHHIAGDAWSRRVFSREISELYDSFRRGTPSPLDELPVQYADYASWQRRALDASILDEQLDYWRGRLAGAPPALALPTDFPRSERLTFRGEVERRSLPSDLVASVRSLGEAQNATPFLVLLAVFAAVLARVSGQRDLVVGIDAANRPRSELEGLIGFFINQLALRVRLAGNPTFREHLVGVRQAALGAYAHQDVPFQRVVAEAGGRREPGRTPLFQVLFTLAHPDDDDGLQARDVEIQPLLGMTDRARFDVTLYMIDRGESLSAVLSYNRDLFRPQTAQRVLDDLERLLALVVREPETRLDAWEHYLTASEEEPAMEQQPKKSRPAGFASFKGIQPKAVAVSGERLVTFDSLSPGQSLPLVVRPAGEVEVDLAEWTRDHRDLLEEKLVEHGAILFRGFGIQSAEEFEGFASQVAPDLFNENSEHPRDSVSGNVYTPVFYPPEDKLLWHNENSFNHHWPQKIFFCCATPPSQGGETPLVDSREIYRLLDPELRARFEERQVLYQRNYGNGLGLDWQTVFQTEDRSEVEERCRRNRMDWDWRDGDRLRTLCRRPAVVRHPVSGEPSWFNQAQHWHTACLDPETRASLTSMFAAEDLPRTCSYGDGSPIADADMETILDVYRELEVAFRWERGDVLLVDNVLTAHGRNPFEGPRKLLVAMGGMKSYDDV